MQPPRQDVRCQESCSSVRGQFSVHYSPRLRLAHPVLDYFVTEWERLSVCFHSSLFLGLVFTFLSVSDLSEYSVEEEVF